MPINSIIVRVEGTCRWGYLLTPPIAIRVQDIEQTANVREILQYLLGIVTGPIFRSIEVIKCIIKLVNSDVTEIYLTKARELGIHNICETYIEYGDSYIAISAYVRDKDVNKVLKCLRSCISSAMTLFKILTSQ